MFEMELAAARAKYEEIHKELPFHDGTFEVWAKERSAETPYHFNDGVTLYVSPVDEDPDGTWLMTGDEAADFRAERDHVAAELAHAQAEAAAMPAPTQHHDEHDD